MCVLISHKVIFLQFLCSDFLQNVDHYQPIIAKYSIHMWTIKCLHQDCIDRAYICYDSSLHVTKWTSS